MKDVACIVNCYWGCPKPGNTNPNIFNGLTGTDDYDVTWCCIAKLAGNIIANEREAFFCCNTVMRIHLPVMDARSAIHDKVVPDKTLPSGERPNVTKSFILHPIRT